MTPTGAPFAQERVRVLLIEDDLRDQHGIGEALSRDAGNRVTIVSADRLAAGIEVLARSQVDIVLVDLRLPDSDGIATVERLQSTAPYVPIIVLSGAEDAAVARDAVRVGAQDCLEKRSIATDPLLRAIGHAIERKRLLVREHAAREDAEAAIRERDRVLAAVSHDLASPLSAIICATYMLQNSPGGQGNLRPEQHAQGLRIIARAARSLELQIEELLDIARLQVGEPLEWRRGQVDLVALIAEVAAEHQARSPDHTMRLELGRSPLRGFWDVARLRRVLDNLVGNALKYTPEHGTVTLSVKREHAPPPRASRAAFAVVTVRDTGIGIPPADLPQVFEPFRRASNVGAIRGTGIGLASARHIVEHHGGTIVVESQEGMGSTFTLRLPLAMHRSSLIPLRRDGGRPPLGGESQPPERRERRAEHAESISELAHEPA
jgi:signal transduction histidine kinase